MYALTAAVLATMAVFASAAPAPQSSGVSLGDLQGDYWTNCKPVLSNDNMFSPAVPLNTTTLTAQNGLWYVAAFSKPWMAAVLGGTDPTTLTCVNWTITVDATKTPPVATMNLNTNPPAHNVALNFVPVNHGSATDLPNVQTLEMTDGTASVTGLSFLQLDDKNAALVGCKWMAGAASTPGTTTYFYNVLTRGQADGPDGNAWGKVKNLAGKIPNTIDVSDANLVKPDNKQCTPAPSSATQVTAMSGLVLALTALLTSRFA